MTDLEPQPMTGELFLSGRYELPTVALVAADWIREIRPQREVSDRELAYIIRCLIHIKRTYMGRRRFRRWQGQQSPAWRSRTNALARSLAQ